MWEERSCRQTREWQHWGSGCYKYKCANGRLHILVGNYSYECYYPGQELSIRIMGGGWLHKGAIICPPCREICGEEFEMNGEHCRPSEEAPPNNMYPRDGLACSGQNYLIKSEIFILSLILPQLLLLIMKVK